MSEQLGILGGTFDPIHLGHLFIAQEAAAAARLDRVLFIPTGQPPHRSQMPLASPAERADMVRLAVAGNALFELSEIELNRPGPSYTIDTLRALAAGSPDCSLYFILGADSLADLPEWRQPDEILELARVLAMARGGRPPVDLEALDRAVPGAGERVCVIESPGLEVSARDIRARIPAGRPIRYLVPDTVESYIREHGLYTAEGSPMHSPLIDGERAGIHGG